MPSSSFTAEAILRARGISHRFISDKADGGDATLVRPSNWNVQHVNVAIVGSADLASFFSTQSDTYVDVTGLSVTLSAPVACRFLITGAGYGRAGYGGSGGFLYLGLLIDSGTTKTFSLKTGGFGEYCELGFSYITDELAAGSHTFKIQMHRSSGGTQGLDEYHLGALALV